MSKCRTREEAEETAVKCTEYWVSNFCKEQRLEFLKHMITDGTDLRASAIEYMEGDWARDETFLNEQLLWWFEFLLTPEAPKVPKTSGWVYVIRAGDTDCYKIGYSTSGAYGRLEDLQRGNQMPLSIVLEIQSENPRKLEARLHRLFRHLRMEGEWFRLSSEDLTLIVDYYTT